MSFRSFECFFYNVNKFQKNGKRIWKTWTKICNSKQFILFAVSYISPLSASWLHASTQQYSKKYSCIIFKNTRQLIDSRIHQLKYGAKSALIRILCLVIWINTNEFLAAIYWNVHCLVHVITWSADLRL